MPQLVSSKNLLHSTQPQVVGVINSASLLEGFSQTSLPAGACDILEIRLDTINLPADELLPHLSQLPLPLLLTARHPNEGGDNQLSTEQRIALVESCLPLASLVDIELRSVPEMQSLIRTAQGKGVGVIGSFHDFHNTPPDELLRGSIDFALQFKLDAVKIATYLHNAGDLARLLQLLQQDHRLPLSAMGMGSLGPVSRIALARCGSLLNYGYLGQPNAPGQMSAPRLKELLKEI